MDPKRVVITGMGIISSVGKDLDTYWNNLKNGVGMDKPFVRKQDHFTQYAMAAAWQAMQQSGLCSEGEGANIDPYRLGVYVGSGIGGFEVQYRETQKMLEDPTGKWISPLFIATMISNIAAGHVKRSAPCVTATPTPSSPAAPSTPPFPWAWPVSSTPRPSRALRTRSTRPSPSTPTGRAL